MTLMESTLINRIQWTPALVRKFWDGIAQTGLDNLSFEKRAGAKFLELVSPYLAPGGKHLDFGAGSGYFVQMLLERGLTTAGFDPMPERKALWNKKIGPHKNFQGMVGVDSHEQFDVVLLTEVIEHVLDEDFDPLLERVAGFVKSGGHLIVATPNNENLELASVYCPVSDTLFHPRQHVRKFSPDQLARCLAGFDFAPVYLALTDFSHDPGLLTARNDIAATVSLRTHILKKLSATIKKSATNHKQNIQQVDAIKSFLDGSAKLGAWHRLKLRLHLLRHHRELITNLLAISHNVAHSFDNVSTYTIAELNRAIELKAAAVTDSPQANDDIDFRWGNETTIVYVGKKI